MVWGIDKEIGSEVRNVRFIPIPMGVSLYKKRVDRKFRLDYSTWCKIILLNRIFMINLGKLTIGLPPARSAYGDRLQAFQDG